MEKKKKSRVALRVLCEGALMVALAHIPFLGFSFTGCLAVLLYAGREYRFATYRGVRIADYTPEHICLRQGRYCLELFLSPLADGQELRAPVCGVMSGRIRESRDAGLRLRLQDGDRTVLDVRSARATCEIVL